MPTPYDAITADTARKYISDATPAQLEAARKFVDGDHWQDGEAWVGPKPSPEEADYQTAMDIIQSGFTSRNVTAEVVDRHADGVLGREPRWGLTVRRPLKEDEQPTDAEKNLIDEAEAALTEWWDARKVHEVFQDAVKTVGFATRGALRLFIPAGAFTGDPNVDPSAVAEVSAADLQEALTLLWVEHPMPESSVVYTDPTTKREIGVVTYEVDKKKYVELYYLGEANTADPLGVETEVRVMSDSGDAIVPMLLGGRILMHEMRRPPLVTEQLLELQRALNLAISVLPRSVVTAGFLERVFLNAQMPGEWEYDEAGERKRFVPMAFKTGAGTTQFVRGIDTQDPETGKTLLTTPSVNYKEPSSVQGPVEAVRSLYLLMLEEAKQSHVLMNADAGASGKSREQSRADYEASLRVSKSRAEACGRWLIETALSVAEFVTGTPGKYTDQLRAEFTCTVDTGPISDTERTSVQASVDGGLLSPETGMALIGVQDVDAELARMQASPGAVLDRLVKQAPLLNQLTGSGVSLEAACELVGFTPEQMLVVKSSVTDVVPTGAVDPNAPPGAPGGAPGPKKPGGNPPPAVGGAAGKTGAAPATQGAAGGAGA